MAQRYSQSKLLAAQVAADDNGYTSSYDDKTGDEYSKMVSKKDSFWFRPTLEVLESSWAYWNKSFPYQLIIARRNGGAYESVATFTLPIPPESMQISMPFAINTTVTLGGIVEEHNGTPLRMISFSGTTGIVPLKGTTELKSSPPVGSEQLFAGTVTAGRATAKSAEAMIAGVSQQGPSNLLKEDITNEGSSIARSTGYAQFRLLQRFLEGYASVKKQAGGADYRLIVAIWKDQALYLVTPMTFDVRRSAQSPFEYMYSLQFKAWKRIDNLKSNNDILVNEPIQENKNWIKPGLDRINAAFDVITNAEATIRGIRADVDNLLFEPIRTVAAAAKMILNVPITLSDLPVNIIVNARKSVEALWSVEGKYEEMKKAWTSDKFDVAWKNATRDLGIEPQEGSDWNAIENQRDNGTLSARARKVSPTTSDDNAPWIKVGGQPSLISKKLLGIAPMSDFKLTPVVMGQVATEKSRLRNLDQSDYQGFRDSIEEFANDYAIAVGASTNTYDRTYGLTELANNIVHLRDEPTDEDYEVLWAINDIIIVLDKFLVSKTTALTQPMSAMEYIGGLANRSGIAFTQPVSKFGIPFTYGTTLERLAARYLNNPNRWHEIAALNGLRSPYVDEVGFDANLIVSGSENQVIVSYTANIFVGQPIWISSSTVSATKRFVTGLEHLGNNLVIRVSGDRNMEDYKHFDSAKVHAYLPDTINSQQLIYIPSSLPSQEESFRSDKIPTIDSTDALLKIAGIDLLLTSDMDLVITPDGDGRWAVGLNNLIQRLKIGIATPVGSLLQHPDYGINLQIGMSVADLSPTALVDSIKNFVATDPAFTGVQSAEIVQNGPSLSLAVTVGVNGVGTNIPIVTTLK